jgi:glycosyltransferase involved in cell wall biosynthesis
MNVPYEQYPSIYRDMDVFVSVSRLEGGPIPLVEAMMSNVTPVVSNTGFASDIIEHGKNGFIFSTDATASEVAHLVRRALTQQCPTRTTVENLNWKSLSATIWQDMACVRDVAMRDTQEVTEL